MDVLTKEKPFMFDSWQEAEDAYYSFPIHIRTCVKDPDVEQEKIIAWLEDNNLYVHE